MRGLSHTCLFSSKLSRLVSMENVPHENKKITKLFRKTYFLSVLVVKVCKLLLCLLLSLDLYTHCSIIHDTCCEVKGCIELPNTIVLVSAANEMVWYLISK